MTTRSLALATLLLLVGLLPVGADAPGPTDLTDIKQVRSWFIKQKGQSRLVLFVSPT